jgi:hypothetical protein
MKTTNIILVGVIGVGAVGAYMYMKNKQAQNALLTGSLPATNQGGVTTPSGTTPSGTTPSGITTSGTTTSGTTTSGTTTSGTTTQNTEVFLPSDNDMKLVDAMVIVTKINNLKEVMKKPFVGEKFHRMFGGTDENKPSDWTTEYKIYRSNQTAYPKQLEKFINDLDNLDYALDDNNKLVKLDPKRNKEWIKIQKLYMSLVNLTPIGLISKQNEVKELAKYGYKVDPVTKKLITI